MIKYIFAATIFSLTFGQTQNTITNTPINTPNQLKCIPRPQGPRGERGPIPKRNGQDNKNTTNLVRQTPPARQNGQRTRPQARSSEFSDQVIKAAANKVQTEWKAFISSSPDSKVPPPSPTSWLRYQQANKIDNSAKIPVEFFQKWQTDFNNMPKKPQGSQRRQRPQRPVGADGKPLPFCDETPAA